MLQLELVESTASGCLKPARADRTRIAYELDWRCFERWCCSQREQALPASTATLGRYLVHLAHSGKKSSTIKRARISIDVMHCEQGLPRPGCDQQIRELERGIARGDNAAEQGAPPLQLSDLERMMRMLGSTLRDERDRALILLGFAGAFRSSELVALDINDLTLTRCGMRVRVSTRGETPVVTEIQRLKNISLCPVSAIERWLSRLTIAQGALFRTVYGPRVTNERLAPRAVSRAVQRAAARAGLNAEYSSHSLRSGLATSARAQGKSARYIQMHGRWKDSRSLGRYIGHGRR
jgi:integrase